MGPLSRTEAAFFFLSVQVEVGGEPVQVATPDLDLSKELKRGLAFVRTRKKR